MQGYRFIHPLNLVVIEFGERVDDAGLLEHLLRVYDDPGFVPGMDEISSFAGTREVDVTAAGLRSIARSFPRPGHEHTDSNLVAVVTTTKLGHGLSRLYAAHASRDGEVDLEIVSSMAAAGDWLDRRRGRDPGTTPMAISAATG